MDRRTLLIEAADRVVRERGLAGATTRAITAAAECAEGTLYLYFKGRADLFLAIFERRLASVFGVDEALERGSDHRAPRDVLLDVCMRFLRFHRESGPLLASLFAEPELLRHYRALILDRFTKAPRAVPQLVDYLRAQKRRKRIATSADPDVVAQALLGACFARAFHDTMFAVPVDEAADRRYLRALIAALVTTPR